MRQVTEFRDGLTKEELDEKIPEKFHFIGAVLGKRDGRIVFYNGMWLSKTVPEMEIIQGIFGNHYVIKRNK